MTEYLDCVLEYMCRNSHPAWKGKKPTVLDFQKDFQGVEQFIRYNAITPAGNPLVLPHKNGGTTTKFSVDGAACSHCKLIVLLSVVVCPACVEQLTDGAGPRAPFCFQRCAPAMSDNSHYQPEQTDGKQPLLVCCHSPLVMRPLSNGRAHLLVSILPQSGIK